MQYPTTPTRVARDLVACQQRVDGARHVARGAVHRQLRHELAGLVHLVVGGQLAVVEVGRQRHEALAGELVAHGLDPGVETPPLLDHDHARHLTRRRGR